MNKMNERLLAVDNMKAVLIGCVVLGHLCEVLKFPGSSFLYLLIYSFHMPAFVFLSGFCSSAAVHYDKIVKNYVYPYVVFQILYVLFDRTILAKDSALQFVKPYWLLWYLMALIIWNILLPFAETDSPKKKAGILTGAVLLALLAGYDKNIGYEMSLSRVIVFFPFFLAGFYSQSHRSMIFPQCDPRSARHKRIFQFTSAAMVLGLILLLFEYRHGIKVTWLYESTSYEKWHYNAWIRLLAFCCAAVMIRFLCVCMPNRRLAFITKLGQNTMPVFLLHGFVIRLIKYYPLPVQEEYPVMTCLVLELLLLIVLSSEAVRKLCRPLLSYPFAGKLTGQV